ncbi:porin [Epibacterium ulvae]|uniref:Porin n=1 Tax=Epibacterium ulvae TaxID=1156985 RepID=A0A1G5RBS3_9RHOB|nr:porin [Epibacterium ulvae]SCZ71552.1 porin [Epibacterium ulvae]
MTLKHTALAALLTTVAAAPAFAGPTYENASGGTFTFYGHFNLFLQSVDDGEQTFDRLVDNNALNSRVGFRLSQPLGENTLRFQFETALGLRSSSAFGQGDSGSNVDWDRTDLRRIDFALDTPKYGTFSFGQGSTAADGAAEVDFSGTDIIGGPAVDDFAGGFAFRTSAGDLSGVTVGSSIIDLDGGRLGRVRYDTPTFGGFRFAASFGTDILAENNDREVFDISLRYNNDDLGDFRIAGALAATWDEQTGREDIQDVIGSLAVEHKPTNVSVALAAGDRDIGGDYAYVKLGYAVNALSVGESSFFIDYYDGSDTVTDGDSAESWGIGVVQDIDKLNLEAYLSYREYSYDDTSGTDFQDLDVVIAGARWRF